MCILLLKISTRLSSHYFKFTGICSTYHFFTDFPFSDISKGFWSFRIRIKITLRTRPFNGNFMVFVKGDKNILCYIGDPVVIIIDIRNIT